MNENMSKANMFSYIIMRKPYDAKADAERYIKKLRKMEDGEIPPAIGVEIRNIDPNLVMRMCRANAENTRLDASLRDERARLAAELQKAFDENLMVLLTEVGVDPEALKYTAELNSELIKERKKWMELYLIKDEENHRLEREIISLKGQLLKLSGKRGGEV